MLAKCKLFWVLGLIVGGLVFNYSLLAQSYSLQLKVTNSPESEIILATIKGDKITPIDTLISEGFTQSEALTNSKVFKWSPDLKSRDHFGVFRLILGQTTYAKIMNEPPQQLDFIYNDEDVVLKTDFKHPVDSLRVLQSLENQVWYSLKKELAKIEEELAWAEKELDYAREQGAANSLSAEQAGDSLFKMRFGNRITRYNQLQKQRDSLINTTIKNHPKLYASKLIATKREPFLDGNLSTAERILLFKKKYLKLFDFTDEALMNSQAYTKIVFKYLMSYAQKGLSKEQQEQEFKKAIDNIVSHTNHNEKVYEFILDYLVNGFEKLRMENLITYIADKYSGTTCQSDEVTTFERKLLQQKMKVGTEVPNFTLNDLNGDPVTLSEIVNEKNLIIFWASWCPHCNEMIPQICQLQKQNPDMEIIAISLDENQNEWENKVFELEIESWYNLSSLKKWNCPVVLDYNVYATPTLFVIDRDRKILGKPLTILDLKVVLNENSESPIK